MTLFSLLMSLFVLSAPFDVEDVRTEEYGACAKTENGMWWCWGDRLMTRYSMILSPDYLTKQTKQYNFLQKSMPVKFSQLSGGAAVICGIAEDKTVWCWGDQNEWGGLGDGTVGFAPNPVPVFGMTNAKKLFSVPGEIFCAQKEDNSVWCWGWNLFGQLGLGVASSTELVPVEIFNSSAGVVSLGINFYSLCAVLDTGKLMCAGTSFGEGQRVLGPLDTTYTFVEMPGISNAVAITGGSTFGHFVLLENGDVVMFGTFVPCSNRQRINPDIISVFTGQNIENISASDYWYSLCFTKNDKSLWCAFERSSFGTEPYRSCDTTPWMIPGASNVQKFTAVSNGVFWLSNGGLYFAGTNNIGLNKKLSLSFNGTDRTPYLVATGVSDYVAISADGGSVDISGVCYIKAGDVYCIGYPADLFITEPVNTNLPTQMPKLYKNDKKVSVLEWQGLVIQDVNNVIRASPGFVWGGVFSSERPSLGTFEHFFSTGARSQWFDDGNLYETGSTGSFKTSTKKILKASTSSEDLPDGILGNGYISCFVYRDGTVWCWGDNAYKQLGDGTTTEREFPTQSQMTDATKVAVADRSVCALKSDKTVWCWGNDSAGQLGNGPTVSPNTHIPTQVKESADVFLTDVASVSASRYSHCAVKTNGSLWCWGGNGQGTLGLGDTANKPYATLVTVGGQTTNVEKSVLSGENHYIITKTKKLYSCGMGAYGDIGDGQRLRRTSPVLISFTAPNVTNVAIGTSHIHYLNSDGVVWGRGNNRNGVLGTGNSTDNGSVPVNPKLMWSNVRHIAAGNEITCGVLSDKSVVCMGDAQFGKLGNNFKDHNWPIRVQNMESGTSTVSAKTDHVCALKEDGSVWCWGRNKDGQLGVGDNTDKYKAMQTLLTGVYIDVSVGTDHSCAVKNDGTVWCFGSGTEGQLGNGKTIKRNKPTQVTGITGATRVVSGDKFSCALKSDNTVWCWGFGENGELGNGYFKSSKTPKQSAAFNVSYLAAGMDHVCVVKSDGSAHCWGKNEEGKLGVKSNLRKINTPMPVSSVTSGANSISLGSYMSCVTKTDGTMSCWGKTTGMTFWD